MTDESVFEHGAVPADIIGTDDLQPVAGLPPVWMPVIGAVVRITTPAESGSGFFIAADRVITNHHVVPDATQLARGGVRSGFAGQSAGVRVTVPADPYFVTSPELDYTVFEVEPVPGVVPLFLANADRPRVGEQVTVIGHRRGGPLEYASADGAVTSVEPPHVEYRADTESGMSGSPVLRSGTRRLLALHHFGDDDHDESNRGVLATVIARELGS
jgi:V8-like Glu-specific endopeptidase